MSSAPGVHIEESSSLSLSIRADATAVPLLVGQFPGKDGKPVSVSKGCVRIGSWMEFAEKFGTGSAMPAVTIKSTAPGGGGQPDPGDEEDESGTKAKSKSRAKSSSAAAAASDYSYEITVADKPATFPAILSLRHYFENGGGPCYLLSYAKNAGGTADEDVSTIAAEIAQNPEISLLVLAEPQPLAATRTSIHSQFNNALTGDKGRFFIASGKDGEDKDTSSFGESDQTGFYFPYLNVIYTHGYDDSVVSVTGYKDGATGEIKTLAELATRNPALYRKVCSHIDTKLAGTVPALPPGPAVAGAYCRTDLGRGVWKAPANVPLRSVASLTVKVGDAVHGDLNEKGINVIRSFNSRGAVIYGARTLVKTMDWIYIPVRRLFGAAERDIQKALRPMVFEPNGPATWELARAAIDNYLYALWQKGALLGKSPEEAYFVHVGKNITMTDDDIKQGKMIIKVGMAAVRPAEFVVLEFTQNMQQA